MNGERIKQIRIKDTDSIRTAMERMNRTGITVCLVMDSSDKLLGVITDGDIRRFIIKKEDLDQPVTEAMTKSPVSLPLDTPREHVFSHMSARVRHIPLVDEEGRVKELVFYSDFLKDKSEEVKIIRAKAPLRISFAGGGTDIEAFFQEQQGIVLSTTINRYVFGTLVRRKDAKITITSADYDQHIEIEDVEKIVYDGKLDLIKAVIKLMKPCHGFDLYLHSGTPPGSGMGGSGTVAIVVAGLINQLLEDKYDEYKLTEIAYAAERKELDIAGGWQDQYAAAFGGFNLIQFKKSGNTVIPLRVREDIMNELGANLLLFYTGIKRDGPGIHVHQRKSVLAGKEDVLLALKRLKKITSKMKDALLRGELIQFGKLLHESWENKKRVDPRISSPEIDTLYTLGIRNGALGGKILGAGGGGHLVFFCPPMYRQAVQKALEKKGCKTVEFDFDSKGLQVWEAKEYLTVNHVKD